MDHEEYRGRSIEVRVLRLDDGFSWQYQIDGGAPRRKDGKATDDEEATRNEAFTLAKAEVDRMDAI